MRVQILIFRFKVLTGVFTYKCFHLNTKFNCLSFCNISFYSDEDDEAKVAFLHSRT